MSFKNFNLSEKIAESENELGVKINTSDISSLDPLEITNWEYRDRNDNELGDISHLANSISTNGQAQPIIVTLINDVFKAKESTDAKYVVIAGYRRWLACKSINLHVESIVKKLSFQEAIGYLLAENQKQDVSDSSKGQLYSKLIKEEKITQNDLSERLGINKNKLSNYMSYESFPLEFINAVKDMSVISARTAGYLRSLFKKGDRYKNSLIKHSRAIANGAGERVIQRLVDGDLNPEIIKSDNKIIETVGSSDKKAEIYSNGNIIISECAQKDKNYDIFLSEFNVLFKTHFDV